MRISGKSRYLLMRVILAAFITIGTLGGCGKQKAVTLPEAQSAGQEATIDAHEASTDSSDDSPGNADADNASSIADSEPEKDNASTADISDSQINDTASSEIESSGVKQDDNETAAVVSGLESTNSDEAFTNADLSDKQSTLDEDGSYTSKDDVALYIHLYGRLPSNFITKKEAKKLGWSGGSLEEYAPGKCIGGDYFGNYEGLLPEKSGREYHECDIDTLGKSKRGAKRIIYSNDELIYYTQDHYKSFELLYGEP